MRVLVAFDKFKDALSAPAACAIAHDALHAHHPDWAIDTCPLSDGGDGFAEILTRAAGGKLPPHLVTGPRGAPTSAALGLVPVENLPPAVRIRLGLSATIAPGATLAVIDLASASGLALLPPAQRDPWFTTTFGTGELIRLAADAGAAAILLGVGGSATNDLGLGALAALGLEFHASAGRSLPPPVPANWKNIVRIGGRLAPGLPPIFIACDVDNPLLGPRGCAAVYGPQKGLPATELARMENDSARLALMLCVHAARPEELMDSPGAGAAGGTSFGLAVAAGARLVPGFDLFADWLDLDRRIAAADLVLTGEGRFDESSLAGKGPGAIVARSRRGGRCVHVFAGSVAGTACPGAALHALTPAAWPLDRALAGTAARLRAAIQQTFPTESPATANSAK